MGERVVYVVKTVLPHVTQWKLGKMFTWLDGPMISIIQKKPYWSKGSQQRRNMDQKQIEI